MNPFIEGRNAGISMIPVVEGKKVPAISWKQFQVEICSELQAVEWGSNGQSFGVGAVTGEVSGRLMAIDIEAAFVPRLGELAQRMRAAGVYEVWMSWLGGYHESTPRGGIHVLVRLEGEGPCPRNDKLAFGADGEVIIETRGEGGYVLVAPTPGYTLGSGGFEVIVYCTLEEWVRVEAVLRSFDEVAAPAPTVATRSTVALPSILRLGEESWIEPIKAGLPAVRELLEGHGWVFPGSGDQFGEHCVRPGKNVREGHSANLSRDGYLWVHSSNAGLPVGVGLDAVDLLICWESPHSVAPTNAERTEWFKAQRPPAVRDAGAAGMDPVAGLNLPASFWEARPYLGHIHQAALSLRLSPDAVWEGVKCFYAATIPWNHRLPGDGTFDYVSIVVGAPGAGKSRAKHCAWMLLEKCRGLEGVAFPAPAGSGEGMTDLYLDRDNKERRYKLRGVGFYADEGKFLLDIASRSGNTTMQAIKQMWSGELTGSVAATAERHRWLDPRDVRATLLVSATPDVAAQFMRQDLTDEGLPQRISWGWATYPHPDERPDWPGALDVHVWDHNRAPDNIYTVDLAAELSALIDARQLAAARGETGPDDGLEGHAIYAIEKGAGLHAHLDGRLDITTDDWALATQDWETTRAVREHVLAAVQQHVNDRNIAAAQARAHFEVAKADVHLERALLSLIRKLQKSKTPMTRHDIRTHLASYRKRHQITHHEVIDLAIQRGHLHETADGYATDL